MNYSKFVFIAVTAILILSLPLQSAAQASAAPAGGTTVHQQENPAPQAQLPMQEGPAPLRVMVGKSILINTADRLKRVSITDPAIADALVVTTNQVMIHGRAPGEVTLVVWDDQERSRSFDLRVDVDVTTVAEELNRLMPDQKFDVSASRGALILSGHVVDKDTMDRASALAGAYSKNVINVLTFGPVGSQEVLLEVRFAEVDRTAIVQLGANFLSTGAANTPGSFTTGQFGTVGNPVSITNSIGAPSRGFATLLQGIDPLNLFLFRPDLNLGVTLKLLQQKNLLQILAEPNLIALNGKEASFLAGGEFPIPVPQSGVAGVITIQYKEFGIRLNFTPLIMPNGNIHLTVKPEVSSLDFANGLVSAGFRVPALTTRRASTELELRDGQSFVIAGLMDNRLTSNMSKMPGIGDIPILGNFFRSKDLNKTKTELMVLVTAHRISPSNEAAPTPPMPKPFIDEKNFDSKTEGARH